MKSPLIEPLESRIAPAVISISAPADNPKNEGSLGGSTTFEFLVSIPAAEAADITVDVTTVDGTAIAGEDYVAQTGPAHVTILAGHTQAVFSVSVNQDQKFEANETFTAMLLPPDAASGHTLNDTKSAATATINNDDAPP